MTLRTRFASLTERVLTFAERRLPALTRYRRPEALPIMLHSRRVYILPTKFGLFFGALVFAMALGALNFNNNPALLFTFLVAAVCMVSFHHTVGDIRGLRLQSLRAEPVHAGTPIRVVFGFREEERRARSGLILELGASKAEFSASAESATEVVIEVPTHHRGLIAPGRFRLWTEYPFGIVYSWSWLVPERRFLVYPKVERNAPKLPIGDREEHGTRMRTPGEEWQGLREYRNGDPPRHIAWKQSAHAQTMLVKEFGDPVSDAVSLDWASLGGLDHESRISRLTAWVLAAKAEGLSFRLILPDHELGPGSGDEFCGRCLAELALLP